MMLINFLYDFAGLLFPRLCHACGQALFLHEKALCTACLYQLPGTKFHLDPESPADQVFWGRARIEKASACYYYARNSKVQHLVHALKYRGCREVGTFIGEHYGAELLRSAYYRAVDLVIPVPLHPVKKRKRGYNQSEVFALGLARAMDKPLDTKTLYRIKASATQTRKSRYKRWENVEGIFAVRDTRDLAGRHILLVDDVITTGATIEACTHALQAAGDVKIYVAAIAFSSF